MISSSPITPTVLISTESLENLIPDFLMESSHFYLVILDVEGKVLKFNRSFEKINPATADTRFCDNLSPKSEAEFNYSLELMLGAPKIRRHVMLDHPDSLQNTGTRVWWEFSVVTTPDMDLSAIIGIGVGRQFLEQEMPWNNLVDVLDFGRIALDRDFRIQSWDESILQWFDPEDESWCGQALTDAPIFRGVPGLDRALNSISGECKPKCFLVELQNSSSQIFAALIAASAEGYHLFLVPKEKRSLPQLERQLIAPHVLSTLQGAVYVLDRAGKLAQQNEAARNLGRIWKGRAYSEGFALTFPTQTNRFSKLLRAIEDAKKGVGTDLELKLLMPNQEFAFWNASLRPIEPGSGNPEGVLIQVFDMTPIKSQLVQITRENERLRDLALSPSHVLRGPLSSIIGLLELIDVKQLDKENQKLFNYLKPLAKELDHTIRQHAKKMSTFH